MEIKGYTFLLIMALANKFYKLWRKITNVVDHKIIHMIKKSKNKHSLKNYEKLNLII